MMIPNITYEILHPVHANRFYMTAFGDWKSERVGELARQLVSVSYELDFSNQHNYSITMTFEDDINMTAANNIKNINPRMRYDIKIDQVDGNASPFRIITFDESRLVKVNYDLDYAASATAKFVLQFEAQNIHLTKPE